MQEQDFGHVNFYPVDAHINNGVSADIIAGKKDCEITSEDVGHRPSKHIIDYLGHSVDLTKEVNTVSSFIETLFATPEVDGAAFLSVQSPNRPKMLFVEVVARLEPETTEASNVVKRVIGSRIGLAKGLKTLCPVGSSFVNSFGVAFDEIKKTMAYRWDTEVGVTPLQFVIFNRK